MSHLGLMNNTIPDEVTTMRKRPFVVMGLLDCLTCTLLTFSAVYLPGTLLILLPQATIPISMMLSRKIKGERYRGYQYLGAVVVVMGILAVLEPLVTQRHAPAFACEAYDEDEFCALCGEETTEGGCLSHRTKGWGELMPSSGSSGLSLVVQPWDEDADEHSTVLRSLARSNSSSSSSLSTPYDDHDGELCRWVSSDSAQQSSSSSSASTTTLIWSVVTILACIPMTLSSIYKEMALSRSQTSIDPIFLNGVSPDARLFSFVLSIGRTHHTNNRSPIARHIYAVGGPVPAPLLDPAERARRHDLQPPRDAVGFSKEHLGRHQMLPWDGHHRHRLSSGRLVPQGASLRQRVPGVQRVL